MTMRTAESCGNTYSKVCTKLSNYSRTMDRTDGDNAGKPRRPRGVGRFRVVVDGYAGGRPHFR